MHRNNNNCRLPYSISDVLKKSAFHYILLGYGLGALRSGQSLTQAMRDFKDDMGIEDEDKDCVSLVKKFNRMRVEYFNYKSENGEETD
jgi:hypothetical protein